jgi:hypothetical protein
MEKARWTLMLFRVLNSFRKLETGPRQPVCGTMPTFLAEEPSKSNGDKVAVRTLMAGLRSFWPPTKCDARGRVPAPACSKQFSRREKSI